MEAQLRLKVATCQLGRRGSGAKKREPQQPIRRVNVYKYIEQPQPPALNFAHRVHLKERGCCSLHMTAGPPWRPVSKVPISPDYLGFVPYLVITLKHQRRAAA